MPIVLLSEKDKHTVMDHLNALLSVALFAPILVFEISIHTSHCCSITVEC